MPQNLYLGFDLSTQQIKCVAVNSDLKLVHEAKVDFDADFGPKYGLSKGVLSNPAEGEIYTPVALWLESIDLVLARLRDSGLDFSQVVAISGAGMQHGTVFWSMQAEELLSQLKGTKSLLAQLGDGQQGKNTAFSHPDSPNWQDASTQKQCDSFDAALGNANVLADLTGSKAHHRFSGPQIMRFRQKYPTHYAETSRISLVSSFLASIFLGKFASIDIGDVCGMNLWSIKKGEWHEDLLSLIAGRDGTARLREQLGPVLEDGGGSLGTISKYFVDRYGFHPRCTVAPFTGDNPSTILSLPLHPGDAIVSLGTSTTFLMSTPQYKPHPSYHFMNHPTTAGLYMFMLCYKNGSLAREQIRNQLNDMQSPPGPSTSWELFDKTATSTAPLCSINSDSPFHMGLYFPRHEIVPSIPPGTWRFFYDPSTHRLTEPENGSSWTVPHDDARAIVESQMLSLRLRSTALVSQHKLADGKVLPPQPRRIYLVGGGSVNPAIAQICGEVLGGAEGVYRLDIGGNACALGAAYKAVWSHDRKIHHGKANESNDLRGGKDTEKFEELIGRRWREDEFVVKVDKGYRPGVWEKYGEALKGFAEMEELVGSKVAADERAKGLKAARLRNPDGSEGRDAYGIAASTLVRERDIGVGFD